MLQLTTATRVWAPEPGQKLLQAVRQVAAAPLPTRGAHQAFEPPAQQRAAGPGEELALEVAVGRQADGLAETPGRRVAVRAHHAPKDWMGGEPGLGVATAEGGVALWQRSWT